MKTLPLLPAVLLAVATPVAADIYADFTVSTGTPPATTPLGTFRVLLEHTKAPRPVAHFIGLATGQRGWIDATTGTIRHTPLYDGLTFHRLEHNFVIQGGDPAGNGTGGPGVVMLDQFHEDLRHSGRYVISFAKSSLPMSTGSQFFILLGGAPFLDDKHSVFGEVISGKNIIDDFADPAKHPTTGSTPDTQINIDSVVIGGTDFPTFDIFDPALKLPTLEGLDLSGARDEGNSKFTVTVPLSPQSAHPIFGGDSLPGLSPLGMLYSADVGGSTFDLDITGVTGPRYFSTVPRADYSLLTKAPSDVADTGHQLVLSDRSGNALTLTFTSGAGGTWTHSDTSSGTFTVNTSGEMIPSSGVYVYAIGTEQRIPTSVFDINLTPPAGPTGWINLGVYLTFHDATSGWVEGSAVVDVSPVDESVRQSFTYTP